MSANNVEALEVQIDQARAAVNLKDDLIALQKNKAFNNIINEGYFRNEAIRLVGAKADPALQDEVQQKALDRSIIGIGELNMYFHKIISIGNMMERTITEAEKEMELALEEDL